MEKFLESNLLEKNFLKATESLIPNFSDCRKDGVYFFGSAKAELKTIHPNLHLSLKENNYILIFKPILFDNDRKPKGNVDADLVLQSMIEFNNYSKAIIVSSDGDFYCLVKYLYGNEKLLKVISPDVKNCSKLLKKTAKEKIVFMDNLRKKLEYLPKKKSTV